MDQIRGLLDSGAEIAGYRVESFIGRGGMAVVYRAEDLRLGRKVALKLLAPELSKDERFQQRFIRESRLAASIDHPNIIPLYEAGEVDGALYIVMRYVVGSDLKALMEREGLPEPPRLLSLFRQVAGALDAAHAAGLVHRDVKPGNILVASGAGPEDTDHVYLTDFGLTKRSSSQSGLTGTGHFIGTIDYVAPEQITGNQVDGRTDVYALGCVLYECLTGDPPFQREDDAGLLWAHLVEAPPRVTERWPDVPEGLDAVVATALAKAPDDRFPTCRELVYALQAELREYLTPTPSGAWSGAPWPEDEPPAPPPAPPPDLAATAAAAPAAAVPAAAVPAAAVQLPAKGVADAGTARPGPEVIGRAAPAAGAGGGRRRGPSAAGRRRRRIALVAAAVLVVALAGGLLLVRVSSSGRLSAESERDDLVPFSFRHPGRWQREQSGLSAVFSPRPRELAALFSQKGTGGTWQPVGSLLRSDGGQLTGMVTFFTSTQVGSGNVEELRAALQPLLPADVTFTSGADQLLVGGFAADRLEGDMSDPGDPGTSLHFTALVVQVQRPEPKTVYLVFFAPRDAFDGQRGLFERVQETVAFFD
jgi:tRNA A-37 threonylcarbamoyl transferase component Bud32